MFETLSDEAVLATMHRCADACVRVMALPEAERRAVVPKGSSPEQSGWLSALFASEAEAEAERRGLLG